MQGPQALDDLRQLRDHPLVGAGALCQVVGVLGVAPGTSHIGDQVAVLRRRRVRRERMSGTTHA